MKEMVNNVLALMWLSVFCFFSSRCCRLVCDLRLAYPGYTRLFYVLKQDTLSSAY